ncbi:hypothetical protein FQN50_004495 [Emmonsiellopsis sp. PD_5]|nr:hypothetical protein FQN50_004495 [Emmonsiellopsis sp. PD_5]
MANDLCVLENLLSRLSCRPEHFLESMIRIHEPARFLSIKRDASRSSLGSLDVLPLELLYLTFNMMDVQSLSRICCVSLRGKAVVESLPGYYRLVQHAPGMLGALARTRLIRFHSTSTLYQALLSEKCRSCGEFGPFIFLPTCERCCYECLHRNQSFWVIPTSMAEKCFKLTKHQLQGIPLMCSIPGTYSVGHRVSRRRKVRLVSVKAAKEVAIKVHGSIAVITPTEPVTGQGGARIQEFYKYKQLLDAPLEPLSQNPSTLPSQRFALSDRYCGMASAPFPSLQPDGSVEHGLWCRGCALMWEDFRFGQLAADVVTQLSVPGVSTNYVLLGLHQRARSKSEFLEHIKSCHGALELAPELRLQRVKE